MKKDEIHFLEYRISDQEEGKEVLSILREDLLLTTRKIRAIKQEEFGILLEGKRVTVREHVKAGELLQIMLNDKEGEDRIVPYDIPVKILYEDDNLLFANKPSGIVSHPSIGHKYDSFAGAIKAYLLAKGESCGIHLIGRLDKDTSGILGIAKNSVTKERMIRARQEGKIKKEYIALAEGNFPSKEPSVVTIPMEEYRDEEDGYKLKMRRALEAEKGLTAITNYQLIENLEGSSLLSVQIETGRMHQIRFHMAEMGHPLIGDEIYGKANEEIKRAALHAYKVAFQHPYEDRKIEILAEMPEDFKKYMKKR
ncbi:MAG: RluA family pseudouridine synthase [Eubacteriales bacterium]|nr:RluA family pseudouridine synthase [Eubacteriales bacterium]